MGKENGSQAGKGFEQKKEVDNIRHIKLSELVLDGRNANQGTNEGRELLKRSVNKNRIGRGVLADKAMNVIAGNHTVKELEAQGYTDVIVVPTDGNTLVVTQRTDIDINSREGRELALLDNRVNEVNLNFYVDVINELQAEFELDLEELDIKIIDSEATGSDYEESDASDQMETEGGNGGGKSVNEDQQNYFPVMAALSKADRIRFDKIKKKNDFSTDTETIMYMIKEIEAL
jgi:hypothetical protein